MLLRNKSLSYSIPRLYALMRAGATKTLRRGLALVSGLGASFKWAFWPTTPKYKLGQLIQLDSDGKLGAITERMWNGRWEYGIDNEDIYYTFMVTTKIEKWGDPGCL